MASPARDPRTGEPSITVTVRIRGDRDIAVWQALCFVESQRSCRVAARLIQDAIERAGRDDGVQDLARSRPAQCWPGQAAKGTAPRCSGRSTGWPARTRSRRSRLTACAAGTGGRGRDERAQEWPEAE